MQTTYLLHARICRRISNDNRAWKAYKLGPGRSVLLNEFNEANFKIALNLEYRFPVFGNFKGAFYGCETYGMYSIM